MNIEQELINLCEKTMELLYRSRERNEISQEELNLHLKKKKEFIKRVGQGTLRN